MSVSSRNTFFTGLLSFFIAEAGGFDVILGNPPYVDSEFFKRHRPYERSAIVRCTHPPEALGLVHSFVELHCVFLRKEDAKAW